MIEPLAISSSLSLWTMSMTSIFLWKQELTQIYDFLKKPCVIKIERKYRELCNPTKKEVKMTFEFRNYPPLLASRKPTPYFSLEEKFAFYSGKKWFFSQKGVLTVCLRKKREKYQKKWMFFVTLLPPFSTMIILM